MLRPDWMNSIGFPPVSRVALTSTGASSSQNLVKVRRKLTLSGSQHRSMLGQFKTSHHQQHAWHVVERMVEEDRVVEVHARKSARMPPLGAKSRMSIVRPGIPEAHSVQVHASLPPPLVRDAPIQRKSPTAVGIVTRTRRVALSRALLQSRLVSARYY